MFLRIVDWHLIISQEAHWILCVEWRQCENSNFVWKAFFCVFVHRRITYEPFCENICQLKTVNYFRKKLHFSWLSEFSIDFSFPCFKIFLLCDSGSWLFCNFYNPYQDSSNKMPFSLKRSFTVTNYQFYLVFFVVVLH